MSERTERSVLSLLSQFKKDHDIDVNFDGVLDTDYFKCKIDNISAFLEYILEEMLLAKKTIFPFITITRGNQFIQTHPADDKKNFIVDYNKNTSDYYESMLRTKEPKNLSETFVLLKYFVLQDTEMLNKEEWQEFCLSPNKTAGIISSILAIIKKIFIGKKEREI